MLLSSLNEIERFFVLRLFDVVKVAKLHHMHTSTVITLDGRGYHFGRLCWLTTFCACSLCNAIWEYGMAPIAPHGLQTLHNADCTA